MHDYAYSFDSLWYFHHRLSEGAIAQWNPYALLGKIAVQWNHVPVSIFTPFLIFSGVTLETFHIIHIIGTFLAFYAIYITGRMTGYDRVYSLIPLIVLAGTFGFKYYASFSYMTTALLFYPVAISFFIVALSESKKITLFKWIIFTILLSISLIGLRFEHIVYLLGLMLLIIFILSFYQKNSRKGLYFFLTGISSIGIAVITNLWHISFLLNSMLDNYRVDVGIKIKEIFDLLFLKWIGMSILYHPSLILIILNLILIPFFGYIIKKKLNIKKIIPIAVTEIILYVVLSYLAALILKNYEISNNIWAVKYNVFIFAGVISIYLLSVKKIDIRKILFILISVFSAFYMFELISVYAYSYIPKIISLIIPFGAANLMIKKKSWIIFTIVIYHLIGETGLFFLDDIFGIPWIWFRAELLLVPFLVIMILESIHFFTDNIPAVISKLRNVDFNNISPRITFLSKIIILISIFAIIKVLLLPTGYSVSESKEAKIINISNSSFETWTQTPENDLLPQDYIVVSDEDNFIEMSEIAIDGDYSISLKQSKMYKSFIRYEIGDFEEYRGEYIKLSSWIKSSSEYPASLQIDIQDGIGSIDAELFIAKEEWRNIEFIKYIDKNAEYILISFKPVDQNTAVLMDNIGLDLVEVEKVPVYLGLSPIFKEREVASKENDIYNGVVYEAYSKSETVKSENTEEDNFRRTFICDDFCPFLPAYSQTLNTGTAYSTEIPKGMSDVLNRGAIRPSVHPEMPEIYKSYKKILNSGLEYSDYTSQVVLNPYNSSGVSLNKEILAEENSNTPRVFITDEVIEFGDEEEEYNYLNDIVENGGLLTSQITTSDKNFSKSLPDNETPELIYDIEFQKDDPENIILDVTVNKDAYLAIMDLYSNGWSAYIDGEKVPIYKGYISNRFIPLEQGDHNIQFKYIVPGFIFSLILSIVSWISLLIIFAVFLFKEARRRPDHYFKKF